MAESPDSKASKSLTFRLPNEIYSELEQFAIAKGLVKSDGAIKTTDALITVIKQGLGLSHGVSQNVSNSDVDIQTMIDKAIAPLFARIENLESGAESNKVPEVVGKSEGNRLEESIANSLEPDFSEQPHATEPDTAALPIEKALPDMTSSKAIAATKPKPTYRFHPDGSIILKSIKGIDLKAFKRLDDIELEALGLYRDESGLRSKFFEIQEDQREGKIRQAKAIAEAKTKTLSYSVNKKDGSISTRTITGISIANLKKLDTQDLKILGIRKKLVDGVWKFFPIEP